MCPEHAVCVPPKHPLRNRHGGTQARHEAMHMVEERQLQKQVALQDLDTAATVWMGVAQQRSTNPSCPREAASRQALSGALPGFQPPYLPDHQQAAPFQIGQIGGYILPITIQNRNKMTTRSQQTRPIAALCPARL